MNLDLHWITGQALVFIGFAYSIILHEIGHAVAAAISGDETAKYAGRITLNPIPHIDPIGSILLPLLAAFLNFPAFGWANPVPVNPNNYNNRRLGETLVSLAGVTVNFILCILFMILFCVVLQFTGTQNKILYSLAGVNFVLMYFNLLPIPPMDGWHFITGLLPDKAYDRVRNFEVGKGPILLLILVVIFNSPIGKFLLMPIGPLFDSLINKIASLYFQIVF